LSIVAKLYLIFALLATVTVALASITVIGARRHAALTAEFGSAFAGALNITASTARTPDCAGHDALRTRDRTKLGVFPVGVWARRAAILPRRTPW
jgi:hypothetical protein